MASASPVDAGTSLAAALRAATTAAAPALLTKRATDIVTAGADVAALAAFVRSRLPPESTPAVHFRRALIELGADYRAGLLHTLRVAAYHAAVLEAESRTAVLGPPEVGSAADAAAADPFAFQRTHVAAVVARLAAVAVKPRSLTRRHRLYPRYGQRALIVDAVVDRSAGTMGKSVRVEPAPDLDAHRATAVDVALAVRSDTTAERCAAVGVPWEVEVVRVPLFVTMDPTAAASTTLNARDGARAVAAASGMAVAPPPGGGAGDAAQLADALAPAASAPSAIPHQPRAHATSAAAAATEYAAHADLILSPYFADACGVHDGDVGAGADAGDAAVAASVASVLGPATAYHYEYIPGAVPLSQVIAAGGRLPAASPLARHLVAELLHAFADIERQCTFDVAGNDAITAQCVYLADNGCRLSLRGVRWSAALPSHPAALPAALAARSRKLMACLGGILRFALAERQVAAAAPSRGFSLPSTVPAPAVDPGLFVAGTAAAASSRLARLQRAAAALGGGREIPTARLSPGPSPGAVDGDSDSESSAAVAATTTTTRPPAISMVDAMPPPFCRLPNSAIGSTESIRAFTLAHAENGCAVGVGECFDVFIPIAALPPTAAASPLSRSVVSGAAGRGGGPAVPSLPLARGSSSSDADALPRGAAVSRWLVDVRGSLEPALPHEGGGSSREVRFAGDDGAAASRAVTPRHADATAASATAAPQLRLLSQCHDAVAARLVSTSQSLLGGGGGSVVTGSGTGTSVTGGTPIAPAPPSTPRRGASTSPSGSAKSPRGAAAADGVGDKLVPITRLTFMAGAPGHVTVLLRAAGEPSASGALVVLTVSCYESEPSPQLSALLAVSDPAARETAAVDASLLGLAALMHEAAAPSVGEGSAGATSADDRLRDTLVRLARIFGCEMVPHPLTGDLLPSALAKLRALAHPRHLLAAAPSLAHAAPGLTAPFTPHGLAALPAFSSLFDTALEGAATAADAASSSSAAFKRVQQHFIEHAYPATHYHGR